MQYFAAQHLLHLEKPKTISVIIPNYNGRELLPRILPPLYEALEHTGSAYEIIVSDDASADDSVAFIEANYPGITLLKSTLNRGFSPAINAGIFAAKNDLLLFLNSDVILTKTYFDFLLPYFDKEDTFGVMGRIIGWDDEVIQDGGKYPSFHGTKIKTSGNYIPKENAAGPFYSMYLSGANTLADRKKTVALGGFDEIFAPFYSEDFELSLRAWRIGYKCYYEHNAVCRHKTSTTIKSMNCNTSIRKVYYRNKMFLHAIHLSGVQFFFWYLQNIGELVLQTILGKSFFRHAFKTFVNSGAKWKASKKKFESLCSAKGTCLSVTQVTKTVLSSLPDNKIIRL